MATRKEAKTKKADKVAFAIEVPEDNGAEFLDSLSGNNSAVSFGGRKGHEISLRMYAIKRYGTDDAAIFTDYQLRQKLLEEGLVPVVVNGLSDDDGVFLIHKSELRKAPILRR